VYDISLTVRVPSGMTESDLARPLVEVRDFETGEAEYEIYTYGEENVIVPISEIKKPKQQDNAMKKLAESKIKDVIRRFDPSAQIEMISDNRVQVRVSNEVIPRIIGRGGSTVAELEKMLGIKIDVDVKQRALGEEIDHDITEAGSSVMITVQKEAIGKMVDIYKDDEFLLSSQIGKKARIKIDKRSENGRKIVNSVLTGDKLRVFLSKQ
jgi:ATPase